MADAPAARALTVSLATIDKNYAVAVAMAMQDLDNENAAMVTQQIAKAAAEELYQLSMAGPPEAYRIAAAQAGRDHRVALGTAGVSLASGGSQQNHTDAVAADAGKKAAQQQARNRHKGSGPISFRPPR